MDTRVLDVRSADVRANLTELPPAELALMLARLTDEELADLLAELDPFDAARLIHTLSRTQAADVLLDEAGEDIERLGGSEPLEEPYLRASIGHLYRKRVIWLLVLFIAEAYTGTVLRHFEATLSEMVSLAFFVPLLIGTGGNVGSQTVTTLVRAMGVGEVDVHDLPRIVRRELIVGGLLGLTMGAATYVRAWTLGVGLEIGPVVAVTALFVVIWAALVAGILPLVLRRLRIDPAVVSAPLITTLVDGTGLFIYFTIAQLMLGLD